MNEHAHCSRLRLRRHVPRSAFECPGQSRPAYSSYVNEKSSKSQCVPLRHQHSRRNREAIRCPGSRSHPIRIFPPTALRGGPLCGDLTLSSADSWLARRTFATRPSNWRERHVAAVRRVPAARIERAQRSANRPATAGFGSCLVPSALPRRESEGWMASCLTAHRVKRST